MSSNENLTTIEGNLIDQNGKYAILVSRWNDLITSRLLDGAKDALVRHGAKKENLTIIWAPGSYELPLVAQRLAQKTQKYDAIIALACVIRGGTPHFDYISKACIDGLMSVSLETKKPVICGVLTIVSNTSVGLG